VILFIPFESKCAPYLYIYTVKISILLCRLSHQACKDPETLMSCNDWLKGSVLGQQLLVLTEELCEVGSSSSTSSHSWTLISLVLSQKHNHGEPLSWTLNAHPVWVSYQPPNDVTFCCDVLYMCRVSDRGGVHGEDLRAAPLHSF